MNNIIELYKCIQSEGSRSGRPTIAIRTTGCTHRCFFGEGGWCDSWYTSIHPKKGLFNIDDVRLIYDENPEIKEMMLTGGSPTMHFNLVNDLTKLAYEKNIFITIETEGSHFIKTDYPIDLISLSPKFNNTIPVIGVMTPEGKITDQKMIDQHNKFRMKYDVIREMLDYHKDYHYKPVWNGTVENLKEIEDFRIKMNIPKNKTWLMPGGDNRVRLIEVYPSVIEKCIEMNYNFCSREHIIAYDTKIGV